MQVFRARFRLYLFFLQIKFFSFLLNYGGQYAHYYYAIENIGHRARLRENEHLFPYRAWLEGNFFRCVRARANLRTLMTQKSCAVGMRNAIRRNHLN